MGISRDRGDESRKAATDAAPDAVQVADRWHLLHNLHEAMMREADRHHDAIRQASRSASDELASPKTNNEPAMARQPVPPAASRKPTRAEQRKQASRARRMHRYERRKVGRWRDPADRHRSGRKPAQTTRNISPPSPRRVAWLLLKSGALLTSNVRSLRQELRAGCPSLKVAASLARWFTRLVRQRQADKLDVWLEYVCAVNAPEELQSFARGLMADLPAVEAALSQPWSNGQTEGQINRLKLVKRQMYGRANFDLLRARFLHAA